MALPPLTMQFLTSIHVAGRWPSRSWSSIIVPGYHWASSRKRRKKKEKEKKHFHLQILVLLLRPLLLSGQEHTLGLKPSRTKGQSAPSKPAEDVQHHGNVFGACFIHSQGKPVPKPCFNTFDTGERRPTGGTDRCASRRSRLHPVTTSEEPEHLDPISSVAGRNISEIQLSFRKYCTGTLYIYKAFLCLETIMSDTVYYLIEDLSSKTPIKIFCMRLLTENICL